MRRPRIGIDLDKTLVQYDGWQGISHIGNLLPGAFEFIKELSDQGWYIIIFSARADNDLAIKYIERWVENTFPFLPLRQKIVVTNTKLRELECFVDDRAIAFNGDYNDALTDLEIYTLKKPDVQQALEERAFKE